MTLLLAASGALAVLTLAAPVGAAGAGPDRPNIVLILADDAGFEVFPTYGGESYATPSLDALAATGMQFNHCYTHHVCAPARVAIMTGKYSFRNYEAWERLSPGETTFAHVLRDAGYATGIAGKWQLYEEGLGTSPAEAGFDEHLVWYYHLPKGSRYWQPKLFLNEKRLPTDESDYGPDLFRDFVIDFMTAHQEEPFFIYYPMVLPHEPFEMTPDSENNLTLFNDMVEYMDKIVGQITTAIADLGLSENTLLLFTADNGTDPDVISIWNGQSVRGGKFHPEDPGTRVPLYVNWEGRTPDGAVNDDMVSLADFLPTIAEAAGAEVPKDVDGRTFMPQILGEPGNPREWVYLWLNMAGTEEGGPPLWRFARTQRWKLYDDNSIYDIANDWRENDPSFEDGPAEQAAARVLLQAVMDEIEAGLPSSDLDGNLIIDTADLLLMLAKWGPCTSRCRGNVNDDDQVDLHDLLILLSEWTRP